MPRDMAGVYPPEALPGEVRRAILADTRSRDIRISLKMIPLKKVEEEEL
jgi:hypothetical protein